MAQWVEAALKHADIGQAELARRVEKHLRTTFDRSRVYKILKDERDVSAEEMLAIEEVTSYPAPATLRGAASAPPVPDRAAGKVVRVPLLDAVAAGKLADPMSQIPVQDVPLLAFADLGRGDFFALRVEGDSVDRVSPDGSIVVVNRNDRTLVNGKFYIFAVKGQTTYKMWQAGENAHLAPYSTNPSNKPIFFRRKADLEVIGRVKRTILDL